VFFSQGLIFFIENEEKREKEGIEREKERKGPKNSKIIPMLE